MAGALTAVLSAALLSAVAVPAAAASSTATVGDYVFAYDPGNVAAGATITDYVGSSKAPTIPGTVTIGPDDYAVTTIGDSAFGSNFLTSVAIPTSVTSIGTGAFDSNYLTSVTIPTSVTTIGAYAFDSNHLTSVTISSSVTTVGDWAFGYNELTSVTIPTSVTTIGASAFQYNSLTSVTIPTSVTTIAVSAFSFNRLTSVTIPTSITTIGAHAFAGNSLTSVTIPNSVTTIGVGAFATNSLTSVTIPTSITTISDYAFATNLLTSATIPTSVTTIGVGAFQYNSLTSVTIPTSVTTIGAFAFMSNSLESVTIPDSVTTVSEGAFSDNWLTSVIIPTTVTSIGSEAFESNLLTSVTIPTSVTAIGNLAFYNNWLTSVTIPTSVTSIGQEAFESNLLASVTVPASVTTIGHEAFYGNPLDAVVMQGPVPTTIGVQPFGAADVATPLVTYYSAFASSGYDTPTWYVGGEAYASRVVASPEPLPTVSDVSPSWDSTVGGTLVTITGTHLTGALSVRFDGVAGTALSVSSGTSLTVVAPAQYAGPVSLVVTTPAGSSAPATFTYRAIPVIESVSPGYGPTAGGTTVTIAGFELSDVTDVTFGGVSGTSLSVVDDTELTVVTPPGTSATAPVVLSSATETSYWTERQFFAYLDTSVAAETPTRIQDVSGFTSGVVRCYPVVGLAGVPIGATGVLLNVTAVGPSGNGYVVVYPDDDGDGATAAPLASTVNFEPGRDVANSAMVALPADGEICAFSAGGRLSRLILDVAGYVVPGSGVTMQSAQRLLDTRQSGQQVAGPVAPSVVNTVQVTGNAGVPAGATAVVANITVVGPTAEGHLRVWAAGTPVPNTSVVNYAPGQTKANGQIIALSPTGGLSFESFTGAGTSTNPVQVIIDVVGYVAAGSQFTPTAPTRIVETRDTAGIVGPIPGAMVPNTVYPVTLSDTSLIPSGATAVVLNVTAVGPTAFGNLRVYPDTNGLGTTDPPLASNLNYIPGRAIPNMVIVQIPPDRKIDFYNNQGASSSRTHLIVDVIGYISAPTS